MSYTNNIFRSIFGKLAIGLSVCATLCTTGCREDIDESNRYTFTGETLIDYMENRSEVYSSYLYILDHAHIGRSESGSVRHLLSTYGHYTCFAPTNAAITRFLFEQDSIYHDHLAKLESGEMDPKDFRDTGVHSPLLEDLSDSMCTEIAKNHLLERAYLTIDLSEGSFPSPNMNDRFITMIWTVDSVTSVVRPLLNNNATIIESDVELENGVIQTLDAVLNPSTALLPDLLSSMDDYFAIWIKILDMTQLDSAMRLVEDKEYANSAVCGQMYGSDYINSSVHRGKCYYPAGRKFKYTMLVEPDSVFKANGINNEQDLIALCRKWYGTENADDYTHPNNALYKFVAYHILDRQLQYASGTGPGGFVMENYKGHYDSENMMYGSQFDRYDYFETLLPYTMVKVTRPLTSDVYGNDIVINYAQNKGQKFFNPEMRNHLNVVVMSPSKAIEYMPGFIDEAINGRLHPINKILIYNEAEMAGNVLRERMRWDFTSWFPELTNNNVRWYNRDSKIEVFFIPDGYLKRAKFNSTLSENYYLTGTNGWNNYQGDEMLASGLFDIEYRIPYVPEGTYELRFGYARYSNRSVVQFYMDGKPTGIPVDLRANSETELFIGFIKDSELADEAEIAENDKEMHNRNWMKAPASFKVAGGADTRETSVPMRYVLGTFYLSKGDHWFRMKNVREDQATNSQGHHDYFEIVPKAVVTDPTMPEDRY